MFLKITSQLSLICIEGWETVLPPAGMITPPVIGWVPTVCPARYSVTHTNFPETEDDGDKDKSLGDINWMTALVQVVC